MKIDSCLIVKDEENNIANVINQLLQFSSNIYIVDTGSTDSTIDIIKSYAYTNKVYLDYFEWNGNFSKARNYSISLSQDSDYIFYCDGDEILSDKFVEQLIEFSNLDYQDHLPDVYSYGVKTKNMFLNSLSDISNRYGLFKSNLHSNLSFVGSINESININGHSVNTNKFSGHMVTNHVTKNSNYRITNLRWYIEEQNNKENITNKDLYLIGKELENCGMIYYAYFSYIECVFNNDTEYLIDALYKCMYLYTNYEICRNIKSISITDIVDKMFEKNIINKALYNYISDACLISNQNEYAKKLAIKAYETKEDNCILIDNFLSYDEIHNLFNIVLACDHLKNYKSANIYNDIILKITPENKSAIYNRDYFAKILG